MCFLNQRKIRKVCGFRLDIVRMFGKPLLAAVIMGVITYLVHLGLDMLIGGRVIPTVAAILAAIILYVFLILKMGTLSDDDILALPMGARILRFCRKLNLIPSGR